MIFDNIQLPITNAVSEQHNAAREGTIHLEKGATAQCGQGRYGSPTKRYNRTFRSAKVKPALPPPPDPPQYGATLFTSQKFAISEMVSGEGQN